MKVLPSSFPKHFSLSHPSTIDNAILPDRQLRHFLQMSHLTVAVVRLRTMVSTKSTAYSYHPYGNRTSVVGVSRLLKPVYATGCWAVLAVPSSPPKFYHT